MEEPPPEVCLLPQKTGARPDLLFQAALGRCQPSAPRRPPTSVPMASGQDQATCTRHRVRGSGDLSVHLQPPPRPAGRKRLPCVRLHSTARAAAKVGVQGEVSSEESEISRSRPGPQRKLKTTAESQSEYAPKSRAEMPADYAAPFEVWSGRQTSWRS